MAVGEIAVIPVGTGADIQNGVRAAVQAIEACGLKRCEVTAVGTNVEGNVDQILAAAKAAYDACLKSGAPRAILELRVDHRIDKEQTLSDMESAVQ
jgi:uncharacterized protein (TIGR00106 family)